MPKDKTPPLNFLFEVRAELVDNGLGACAVFTPCDFYLTDAGDIKPKPQVEIRALQSIDYALSLANEGVFNALQYLPQCVNGNNVDDYSYVTIGLYLMLADAVSRKYDPINPEGHLTFLQACHKFGFELAPHDSLLKKRPQLREALQQVLDYLDIAGEFTGLVESWHQRAQYNSFGVHNGYIVGTHPDPENESRLIALENEIPDSARAYSVELPKIIGDQERLDIAYGPYAVLAAKVSGMQELLGINTAVSVALGNRDNQHNLRRIYGDKIPDEAKLENVTRALENHALLIERLTEGNLLRAERMIKAARNHFGDRKLKPSADEGELLRQNKEILQLWKNIGEANTLQQQHADNRQTILNYFPENFLRIAQKKNFTYIYTSKQNICDIYPLGEIPGFTAESVELTRNGNGGNLSRYGLICFALGDRQVLEGTDLEWRAAAQTAIHETVHRTLNDFDMMTPEERKDLYQRVQALPKLSSDKKSAVIPSTSFADIVNHDSDYYWNYNYFFDSDNGGKKTKWLYPAGPEEAICNIYSLWHTEPNRDQSPLNTPEIRELVNKIEEYVQAATNRLLTPKEIKRVDTLSEIRAGQIEPGFGVA